MSKQTMDKPYPILLQDARDAVRELSDEDARIARGVVGLVHVALQSAKTDQELEDFRAFMIDIVTELETR
jgi:sulfur transfer protein SufE